LDKLEADDSSVALFQVDAQRIVKGYLAGSFSPSTLAAWADPDTTPSIIRAIAGRLIAAAFYADRYAEDDPDVPAYAQEKYNQAMLMLMQVQTGALILTEVTEPTADAFVNLDFYPNDDTVPGPLFTIGDPTFG
jgi:hypothetical protein